MRRAPALAVLSGFLVGIVLGCSSKAPDASGGASGNPTSKAGDPPKPVTADAPDGGVFQTPEKLFAGLPKDAYPKLGDDAGLERGLAQKWMNANLVGKSVEWKGTVELVKVTGSDPFDADVYFEGTTGIRWVPGVAGPTFGNTFSLGDQKCRTLLSTGVSSTNWITGGVDLAGCDGPLTASRTRYRSCSEVEVKRLREFQKKEVSPRETITNIVVYAKNAYVEARLDGFGNYPSTDVGLAIRLQVSLPTVDGFIPEASKPKPKS